MLRLVSYSIFQSLLAARSPVNYILNLCVFNIIATIIVPVAYAPLFTSTFHDVQKGGSIRTIRLHKSYQNTCPYPSMTRNQSTLQALTLSCTAR